LCIRNKIEIESHKYSRGITVYKMSTAQQESNLMTTITREMATRFVNIYHATVSVHRADANYKTANYTDDFYAGCKRDEELCQSVEDGNGGVVIPFPFIQSIYDAIHTLMCPSYTLANNIKYCTEYGNIDAQTIAHLNTANKNYHLLNNVKNEHYLYAQKQEDLTDATYEPNTCGICHYENTRRPATKPSLQKFYYSTSFGLNVPVCSTCVVASNSENNDADDKDEEYLPSIFGNNYKAKIEGEEDDDDSIMDAEDAYAVASDENVVLATLGDIGITSPPPVSVATQADEYKAGEYNTAGWQAGEYKAGWQAGWKGAMKYVQEQLLLNIDAPALPMCDNCGIETNTKKCGGSCNGRVRYCSSVCQFADWKRIHKYTCCKETTTTF
jgi:hypothetical protein